MKNFIFTSESVTEGHPDKICDIIADSILDEALKEDPCSAMAVEATIKNDLIFLYGEANTKATIDYETIAKNVLKEIGYSEDYRVLSAIDEQSKEIHDAVIRENGDIGAGDQGIIFGYACDETDEYMPYPICLAHKLAKRLTDTRRKNPILRPDGKTQVSIEYVNGKPARIDTIVISCQHIKDASKQAIEKIIMDEVIMPCVDKAMLIDTKYCINPSGSFIIGGSFGDSGTTGRKIVCDTYGGMGRVGGGCFSSKDPTKVDRSAAYYCRYIAKSLVAHKLAGKVEIQAAYMIGSPRPVSICVDTFGTGIYPDEKIKEIVEDNFDLSVANIIKELDLRRPIYKKTACYGHFGNPSFPWEKIKPLKI